LLFCGGLGQRELGIDGDGGKDEDKGDELHMRNYYQKTGMKSIRNAFKVQSRSPLRVC
jgi:hypothetical protein